MEGRDASHLSIGSSGCFAGGRLRRAQRLRAGVSKAEASDAERAGEARREVAAVSERRELVLVARARHRGWARLSYGTSPFTSTAPFLCAARAAMTDATGSSGADTCRSSMP